MPIELTAQEWERFWRKVDKTGDCWIWTAAKYSNGYGHFHLRRLGRGFLAHRLSFGDVPDGLVIDHTCFTRACVNPAHLRAVTSKQNGENRPEHERGVDFDARRGRWRARVKHDYREYWVGYFETREEAVVAARAKRNELFSHNDVDRHVA